MIEQAKFVLSTYKPPSRQVVAGPLLDSTYTTINQEIKQQILKESKVIGITIFGDGATYLRIPYIHILAARVHNKAGLLDIADCLGHVVRGFKKLFIPHLERLDPDKTRYILNLPISRISVATTIP